MFARSALVVWVLFVTLVFPMRLSAQEIEITGELRLEAFSELKDQAIRVTGQVSDELGHPVQGRVSFSGTDVGYPRVDFQLCSGTNRLEAELLEDELITNAEGQFCVEIDDSSSRPWVHASAAHFRTVKIAATNDQLTLRPPRFAHVPETFDLSKREESVVEVLASTLSESKKRSAVLELFLDCNETKTLLGSNKISGSRMVRFGLEKARSLRPGRCRLEARLSSVGVESTSTFHDILLRDEVELIVEEPRFTDSKIVVWVGVANGQAPMPGILEARSESGALASVPFDESARAKFEFEFLDRPRTIVLSYVPSGPAWLPGPSVKIELPRGKPLPSWPFHLGGILLFVIWVSYQWLFANRKQASPVPLQAAPPTPAVTVSESSVGAIRGKAVDCHTGAPLDGVRVALSSVTPSQRTELEVQTTDSKGQFHFDKEFSTDTLLSLHFTHRDYMSAATRVQAAEHSVFMESNRRAALRRLIDWARSKGAPWDTRPTPTAGHVREQAEKGRLDEIASWANQIATTAYGPNAPVESDVTALGHKPPDPRSKIQVDDPHREH